MASSSKPTAVHFTLAFFVTATLILGIICYLNAKELAKAQADAKAQGDKAQQSQSALTKLLEEVQGLTQVIGYNSDDLGDPNISADQLPDGTVRKSLYSALVQYGKDHVQPSPASPKVSDTLLALRTALDAANNQIDGLQGNVKTAEGRLNQEMASHRNERQQLQTSQAGSEKQLQDKVVQQNEVLRSKDDEIAKVSGQYRQTLVEKEQVLDELDRVRQAKDEEISLLEKQITELRRRLDELEQVSFEVPDGKIVRVNTSTGTVWINLGSEDGLREQVSFSVYIQKHDGMARGKEDVKAKIEVAKIRGPHLSEARIISEDFNRPIQEDDPIYTPLWTPGVREFFAFVGNIDINGDGVSDRALLHDIMANANAEIELEVNDQGERMPADGKLSANTKFLVMGEMPDPSSVPAFDTERRAQIEKISQERTALQAEALRMGVRIVRLADFLTWAGVGAQERLFIPGQDRKFTLKSGSRSGATNEELGSSRLSPGQVSEVFNRDGTGQKKSTGQASGLYKN
ncbi:MAG: hypothetical protein KDA90_15780 [Planctomycetaceae bacterium]|nr:hypothetical protein [Planctomycetaceae bacterium]